VLITSQSVRDAHGGFLYAVRVQTDINDRNQAEESLARRMDEQAAPMRSPSGCSTESSRDVYEPALDAGRSGHSRTEAPESDTASRSRFFSVPLRPITSVSSITPFAHAIRLLLTWRLIRRDPGGDMLQNRTRACMRPRHGGGA
jgi:hypothetical protein